ncbi:MAG: DEAD/DEAH box helicase [Rhizobacter sp.]
MSFLNLGLHDALLKAVADSGYESATEVQSQAIPAGLAGSDLMVSASTGSGKTASFILPALHGILAARGDNNTRREKGKVYGPRVLVLCPTRELAMQVAKAATMYGRHVQGLRVATVVGGVPYPAQIKALMGPLDILISTPGRLLDHLQSGRAVLDNVQMLVLDEADRMLDMGFIDDIQTIADRIPATRQTVMFSATFAGNVGNLARNLLRDPKRIDVASHTDTHENIEQRLHWADNHHHKNALLDHILTQKDMEQAVVFTSTQRDADMLADRLADMGHSAAALHGGMPQGRRNRVLQGLRNRQLRVLVATDVAARGIDVPTISHVINYGLPMKAEDYVHRIGRTGRAGRNGLAVTLAERMDVGMIRRIQQFTTQTIPASAIEGLEPKSPEPRIHAARPSGDFADRPRGKPSFNNGPSRGGFGGGFKKPFAPRRDEGGFGQGRHEGFAPRRDDGFAPRRDAAPRDVHPGRETPFTKRSEGSFVPNRNAFDNAPRKAFDRAPGQRPAGAPAFAPRKASGPGGAPRPAGKGGPFKPQRPRQGGFDR